MATKEITHLTDFQYRMLAEIAQQGDYIYRIERNRAKSLMQKGLLERRGNASYFLTPRAHELMAAYTTRPKRENATNRLISFVQSLPIPGISRQDVMDHLEMDAERGTDTSPKFMRSKGRKRPQIRGKG